MRWLAFLLIVLAGAPPAHAALSCDPEPGRETARIAGTLGDGDTFRRRIGPGWMVMLRAGGAGWMLHVWDETGNQDLSAITPPLRFSPNPREIFGWHFRNAANTGPNTGDVNAPQHRRDFAFLAGDGPGRGTLLLTDMTLTPPGEGRQARMTGVSFEGCLSWPADPSRPVHSDEDREIFGACGLAPPYRLDATFAPLTQDGDIDGDGAWDHVAPVKRETDSKRGIAICRAGTWLDLVGFEPLGPLDPAYLESVDYWGYGAYTDPPLEGVTIGKDGASSMLIHWDGQGVAARWLGD